MTLYIDWIEGNCPVQSEGTFDGIPYYFRARGAWWSLDLGVEGETITKTWGNPYGNGPFDAGWMSEDEAREFITQCYNEWTTMREIEEDDNILNKLKQYLTIMPYEMDKKYMRMAIEEIERLYLIQSERVCNEGK